MKRIYLRMFSSLGGGEKTSDQPTTNSDIHEVVKSSIEDPRANDASLVEFIERRKVPRGIPVADVIETNGDSVWAYFDSGNRD